MAGKDGIAINEFLDVFRGLLAQRRWVASGKILEIGKAVDRSVMRVKVEVFPDKEEVIARMAWDGVGPDAGIFYPPAVDDLVLLAFEEGSEDYPYVIKRLSSKDDTIPLRAMADELCITARSGQKLNLTSTERINIGRGGVSEEAEPLVLGSAFKTAFEQSNDRIIEVIDKIILGPVGIGNLGNAVPTFPQLAADLTVIKSNITTDKLDFDSFLSDIAFTEK